MEKEFEKLIKAVRQFKLTPLEKKKMREDLLTFIKENPVREALDSRPQLQQRSWILYPLRLKPMPVFAVIAAIVLVAGGGTSLAAETSLPGDTLYTVKVNVNEKARAMLALSDEAEAKLAAKLAERRLQEAARLTAEGRLTAEAQAELESRFKTQVDKFESRVNKVAEAEGKAKAAAEISSNFEASLKAHNQILTGLQARAETETKAEGEAAIEVKMRPIVTAIKVGLGVVEKTRINAETKVSAEAKAEVEAAARGKLTAATNKIAEVRAQIERAKGSVEASVRAEAEAKLKLAEEAVAEGKAELEAEAFAKAFASFDRAHRLAQEAQILVKGAGEIKGETSATGSAETSGGAGTETKTDTRGEGKFWLNFGF